MKNWSFLHPEFVLLKSFCLRSNIKHSTVFSPDETPQSSSKILRCVSYFQLSSPDETLHLMLDILLSSVSWYTCPVVFLLNAQFSTHHPPQPSSTPPSSYTFGYPVTVLLVKSSCEVDKLVNGGCINNMFVSLFLVMFLNIT